MKPTVLDSLNQGLLEALKMDAAVYVLGEDILDPYGGAFKVTRGCSTAYPQRVIPTPISEAGLAGVATGMALRGLRPVVEVMFGDFVTLMADQLVNHASKMGWMYNDSVTVPLVIRTPMGGRRGYGPTHSQSLEKLFMGVPGLSVLAPASFDMEAYSPGSFLTHTIIAADAPILFIENKLQYLQPLITPEDAVDQDISIEYDPIDQREQYPFFKVKIKGAPAAGITLTAYGFMAELVRQVQQEVAFEEEIFTELVIPTRLSPFHLQPLMDSVARTGKLCIIEEGTRSLGWGAEVAASASDTLGAALRRVKRLAAQDTPVPASTSLEEETLPGVQEIKALVRRLNSEK